MPIEIIDTGSFDVAIAMRNIPNSTVFTGSIRGVEGPWYKVSTSCVNLRHAGASIILENEHPDFNSIVVVGFKARKARLELL